MVRSDRSPAPQPQQSYTGPGTFDDDSIDLREIFGRVMRGLPQILGLALLGLAIAAVLVLLVGRIQPPATTTRVTFAFPGFERGEYPDRSKFQPDDLRAPEIIATALKRQGLELQGNLQNKIRGALGIESIIPANIVKERDRMRASGQTPPPYVPDEYAITLLLPGGFPLTRAQRENLLSEIVSVYRDNFHRTYADVPVAFGSAFATLQGADFAEYQLVLDTEIESITSYLEQLIASPENNDRQQRANTFRSSATNLSFRDLIERTQLFAQIHLNETLGLIHQNGLSRNRATALIKMDYQLRLLENQERRAVEEERVVLELLARSQDRAQNYVLGIKSQAAQPRSETPLLDQGLVDSLLANDAYNFLMRRALDAGLQVKRIQAEKTRVLELRENMRTFMNKEVGDQKEIFERVGESLVELDKAYRELVEGIRLTYEDFAQQQFADAIRISAPVKTEGIVKKLVLFSTLGLALGAAAGMGFSLLGVYVGGRRVTS